MVFVDPMITELLIVMMPLLVEKPPLETPQLFVSPEAEAFIFVIIGEATVLKTP